MGDENRRMIEGYDADLARQAYESLHRMRLPENLGLERRAFYRIFSLLVGDKQYTSESIPHELIRGFNCASGVVVLKNGSIDKRQTEYERIMNDLAERLK